MKKIVDIAFKDMVQYFRSLIALVMMFAVPILLTGMFYIMFGGIGKDENFEIPVTNVIIVNQDAGEIQLDPSIQDSIPDDLSLDPVSGGLTSMGDFLTEIFSSGEFSDLMNVSLMDNMELAQEEVDNQRAGVALLIPEDFSDAVTRPDGKAVVSYYYDPGLTLGPNIVKGIIQQFLDRFSSSRMALNITFNNITKEGFLIDEEKSQAIVASYFRESFGQPENQAASSGVSFRSPAGEDVANASVDIIGMMMAGMTVFYVFFTGASTAQSLLTEDQRGTLQRLFTTPTPQSAVLGGKFVSGVLMIIVQITVLLLFGYLVFHIEWGALVTLLPLVVSLTLAASTFGVFLMSWIYTERQAGLMIGGVATIMGMLGMIRIFTFGMQNPPQIVFSLSRLVPQGWAVEGLSIAMGGGEPSDIVLNSLVLIAWAVLFFCIGVFRFRNRFA